MKRTLIAASLLLTVAASANAGCTGKDNFKTIDKRLHFFGGAIIAAAVTGHTKDPWTGFYAGTAAGVVKEALDSTGIGDCSAKDLIATMAGAALGAAGTNWYISREGKTTVVGYRWELR